MFKLNYMFLKIYFKKKPIHQWDQLIKNFVGKSYFKVLSALMKSKSDYEASAINKRFQYLKINFKSIISFASVFYTLKFSNKYVKYLKLFSLKTHIINKRLSLILIC